MTTQERWELYENGEFRQTVAIKLLDWAGYWTTAGLDGIESTLQKKQTERAIDMIIHDLGYVIGTVVSLIISDPAIKEANVITEEMINNAVVSVMAYKLPWITGITELPA